MKAKPDWTVLVVSADETVQSRAAHTLANGHTQVIAVKSVKALFEKLRQEEPGLVIYDPNVQPLTGREAFAVAKAYHPDLPAIFLFEEEGFDAVQEIMTKGVLYRMHKPLNEEELKQICANLRTSKMRSTEEH